MNLINMITRSLRRPLILAAMALSVVSATTQAAGIKIECRVSGYSTAGWIEVRTGSNTGGRVQRDSSGYYTDRVQRGEPLRITYLPQTLSERCQGGSWGGIFKFDHGYRASQTFWSVPLAYVISTTCPTDPNWDNVQADISTNLGYFVRRIPIGTR